MTELLGFISEYGLAVIPAMLLAGAFGAPFPEDLITLGAGYLVYTEAMAFVPTLSVLLVAVFAADACMYGTGRFVGNKAISAEKVARVRQAVDRWGAMTVFAARFVIGARAAVFLSVGTMGLPLRKFLVADAIACLIFVPSLFFIGLTFGEHIEAIAEHVATVGRGIGYVVVVVAVVLLGILLFRRFRSKAAAA